MYAYKNRMIFNKLSYGFSTLPIPSSFASGVSSDLALLFSRVIYFMSIIRSIAHVTVFLTLS